MALALGPCMLFAPVVAVLFVLAIPLWPVALAVLVVLLVVTWLLERLCALLRIRAYRGATATVWGWLKWMSKPLNWLDKRSKRPADEQAGEKKL